MAAPPPTPTASTVPPAERTGTTVVLGKTHLAALAALIVVVGIGVAILAFAALRQNMSGPSAPADTAAQTAAAETAAAPPLTPTPEPAPAPGSTPATQGAAHGSVPPPPAATPSARPTPAPGGTPAAGVATVGAASGTAKPAGRGTTAAAGDPNAPAAGRGVSDSKAAAAVDAAPPTTPAAAAAPMATFNEVRVLVNDGEKSREREGILQLGAGQVSVVPSAGAAPIVSLPVSALNGLFYSRSRMPRWKDASGKEVETKIDLGRMGFLRGERNWIVLLTAGEPVILRIEDSALRTVLPALEERTGHKIRR
jgi:hypothetical protein